MGRKGASITLSIKETEKLELETLANDLGYTWGDKPNISKLITAIAKKELRIAINHDWTDQQIQSLEQARQLLIDTGKLSEAEIIARILQQRSELKYPLKQEIEKFLENPKPSWRREIENFISQRRSFQLSYVDPSNRQFTFTVLHAELKLLEKHQYLVCTCQESEGNTDIPELQHNWTFRLDRIQEAAVNPVKQPWQPQLDHVAVTFELYGNLAFNYGKTGYKADDLDIGEISGNPPTRTITRRVFATFWFFRDIAPYFESCQIISPDSVRTHFQEKLRSLYIQYFNETSQ
ncbi:MAG: WYL domain-containing protein [Snowella sp.]|nr:WYL domain-containing protein [Snowella sp.]